MEEMKLHKLDIDTIPDIGFIVCSGVRASGKTVLIKDILRSKKHVFRGGIVMSSTEESKHHYEGLPETLIYDEFREDVLWELIKCQKSTKEQTFVVIDNCMCSKKDFNSKALGMLARNGLQLRICVIMSIQYGMALPPIIRCNTDYFFTFAENNERDRMHLYKYYFGLFDSLSDFKTALTACTEKYEALVISNFAKSSRLQDMVFWYKATVHDAALPVESQ